MKILCKQVRDEMEQLPTVLPHPRNFLPLPAATHYDLRCGKNEGKVHCVFQCGRHRLRLPLALNFPLSLFSFFVERKIAEY